MNKYILVQNWFDSENRYDEYLECLKRNINNDYIEFIYLLCEHGISTPIISDKIVMIYYDGLPTYRDYFNFCNDNLHGSICITSNLDIYYDETLQHVSSVVDNDTVIALSRWNIDSEFNLINHNNCDSQDTWIFESPIRHHDMNIDFTMGRSGCDNRIAYELSTQYNVINPVFDIKSMHYHLSEFRGMSVDNQSNRLRGQYRILPFDSLFSHQPVFNNKQYISYSMFSPHNGNYDHIRSWDLFNGVDRYWYNIPALIVIYKTFHPQFTILFNISIDIMEHKLYPLLVELESNNLIELIIHDTTYKSTEPTLWRYNTIFDKSVDIVFVRDLDSIPNSYELSSNLSFVKSDYVISTIRSHKNHNSVYAKMLSGLSSFKPCEIDHQLSYEQFYLKYRTLNWGMDQNGIIDYVFNQLHNISPKFVDFIISSVDNVVTPLQYVEYDSITPHSLNDESNIELIKSIDSITSWCGQPVDVRGGDLINILNQCGDIGDKMLSIINNSKTMDFYL